MENTAQQTIDKSAIQAAASKAGMTLSEFLEWGLYCILKNYDGTAASNPSDAREDLKQCRKLEGIISEENIPTNPLAEFASDSGLHFGELNELALLTAVSIMNTSESPDKQPMDWLKEARQKQGPLIPSFPEEKTTVHPFMERLFSGDLRAVHGATFGDLASDHVDSEHHFLEDNLQRAFQQNTWDEAIGEMMTIESVIKYCPALQNEAAAIRALIEAERVLGDFCRAVNAC